MADVSALFQPLQLRGVTLKNRIVMTPHGVRIGENGLPTPRMRGYYEARARGGVGLMSTQTLAVYPQRPDGGGRSTILSIWDPASPEAIRGMIGLVHHHGAKMFAQIGYAGRQFDGESVNRPAYAPSPIPWEPGGMVPREMTAPDVTRFVGYYAEAAARAIVCGYDGIEIHGAHGYLIHQFLSPISNKRTDQYGGTLENRVRFVAEIAREVRAAVGEEVPVGLRVSGDEFVEGGLSIDQVTEIGPMVVAAGGLDYLSVSAGAYRSVERIVPPMYFEQGVHAHLARRIKQRVGDAVAVTAAGRIYEPEFAAKLVADGTCDLVGMLRALIADPDMPLKARGESPVPIRKCVGLCDCWRRGAYKGFSISCSVNPEVGRETTVTKPTFLGEILNSGAQVPATPRPLSGPRRKVVVVGAGPAGMEVATRIVQRGHEVIVFDRAPRIGGRINIAAKAVSRSSLSHITSYFEGMAELLGMDVRLSTEVGATELLALEPDQVVLATGGSPRLPTWSGADGVDYFTQGLIDPDSLGDIVVVYSEHQWIPGASVADTLARSGRKVLFVTPHARVAPAIEPNTFHMIMRNLTENDVGIVRDTEVVGWKPGKVMARSSFAHERVRVIAASNLLFDCGMGPNLGIADELRAAGFGGKVSSIGDCFSPRGIQAAFWDALREAEGVR